MKMIAKQQAQHYVQAKRKHLDRLSSLVWHLTGQADLFTSAMRIALFDIWQNAQNVNLAPNNHCLYNIAIKACCLAWNQHETVTSSTNLPMNQYVRRQVAQLPTMQAQLILMRYMEGLNEQEIALRFAWTSLEAGMAVTQAVQQLKHHFSQECCTEPSQGTLSTLRSPITPWEVKYVPNKRPA